MKKIITKLDLFISHKINFILTALIFFVIISGIFYSLHLGNDLKYADEHVYHTLATNIVQCHQFSFDGEKPTAFRPPGYPLLLSAFILLGADIMYLRMINFVLLGLSIYVLYKIIQEQSSESAGLLGAILVIFYPVLFYIASTLYPQTMGACLFLIILYLLLKKRKSNLTFVLSGVLFGLLVLTIPIFILCLFIIGIWFLFFEGSRQLKRIIITTTIACLLISIWCVRNYRIYKSFIFVSGNSGFMLLLGNSENTTPNAGPGVDISRYRKEAIEMHLNSIQADSYYRSKAVEWIMSHKTKALKLYCLKFLNHFNYRNNLATKSEGSRVKDLLMLVTYGPLLLLFICRLLLMAHFRPSAFEILLIVIYLSIAAFYAVFFTRIRYRLPFDFLLIAIDAIFLYRVFFKGFSIPKWQKPLQVK